ncbi:MAG: hypothetical protein ACREJD_08415 [Phycisphaerales bacterium]
MSDNSILDRFITRDGNRADLLLPSEAESPSDDYLSFGWARGTKDRPVMLELRKRTGEILALGYSWLERAHYDPSIGVTLNFVGHKIEIKGRNLNEEIRPSVRLFEGLTRHRVTWIRECDEPDRMEASEKATVIDSIEW